MPETNSKRKIYPKICPPTHDYVMGVALVMASACKDPMGQQAALLTDSKDRIVAHGVNILASADGYGGTKKLEWDAEGREQGMVTAIETVLDRALKMYIPGATTGEPFSLHNLYVTGPPLLRDIRRCASLGLKKIMYGPIQPIYFDENEWESTLALAKVFGLTLVAYEGNLNWLRDKVGSLSHLF